MVIGVPNSLIVRRIRLCGSKQACPTKMGLIKNQYVARTFIQPTQELREQCAYEASAVRSVVKGKRVIVIDDSIVRGTTSSASCSCSRKPAPLKCICASAPRR